MTASVCCENLGKTLVRNNHENPPMLAGSNFTENFTADIPVGIFRNFKTISTAVSVAFMGSLKV